MKNYVFAGVAALVAVAGSAHAETVYGITGLGGGVNLVSFDSATPGTVNTIGALTGVLGGQSVRAIDFRPANGALYAVSTLGSAAQLYSVNLGTGALIPVGSGFTLGTTTSTRISMDFNPVVDRLRIVSGDAQNFRVNPNTGGLVLQDTNLVYDAGDPNFGASPLIAGAAYTNNVAGATTTTLYGYDYILDNLVTIGGVNGAPSPNTGTLFTVGNSGFVTGTAGIGFDISSTSGIGYIQHDSPGADSFYSVDLATGAHTAIGSFGTANNILDISVVIPGPGSLALVGMGGLLAARRRRA